MALIARSGSGGDGRAKRSGRKKILCPNCRNSIHVSEIAYADDSILKEHDEHEEKANNHREPGAQLLPNGNSEVNNASDPQLDFDLEDIRIKGSYGSKLEAVARRVLSILSKDAAAKILVFSEWQDVLELLAHALSANQVPFVYVKGKPQMSKALKQFKLKASCNSQGAVSGDGHTHPLGASVLMLPVKLGANGLNLIEAQHVILIEPLLDPAKEAQAFGRVDRIGQTKKTFVHRFIVSGTVEEKVYQLAQQRASMYSIMGVPASRAAGSSRSKKFSEEQSLTIKDIKELLVDSSS
jgi:E3 ubiquitin-protein ligase SHPRH